MAKSELTRRELLALSALGVIAGAPGFALAAAPQGQLTWGIHVSLAPTWFDPAETPGLITPFMILYALHDAMLKPMPAQLPSGLRTSTIFTSSRRQSSFAIYCRAMSGCRFFALCWSRWLPSMRRA